MRVLKRNGDYQDVSFDKVSHRIRKLCEGLNTIDPIVVAQKICSQIYDGVKTSELDELTARFCASRATDNIEYGTLASRIIISNNHKNTSPSFSETVTMLYNRKDVNGKTVPLIDEKVYNIIMKNKNKLNDVIDYERDYNFDFFGFKTLEKAYLLKINGKVVERVQHLLMRVSVGLHGEDLKSAIESYNYMSQKYFIHASPTLFNAGTPKPALMSCFLIGTEDSIAGIYKTISDCAKISKWAGGIGLHVSNIRGKNALIRGTNGKSTGIIPMLKVYNETLKYVNQGGKRAGSAAIYLEPHHPDIMAFLELRKNHGNEEDRARDLFLALWTSDLFMKRVKNDDIWSLFDPDTCPELTDLYGDEFEAKYIEYEEKKKYVKQIRARDVWKSVINSQIETGTPYVLYKDSANKKSNQKNIGTIKSSNLCVAPETLLLTENGHIEIQQLKDKEVNIWNGQEYSPVIVRQTNDASELINVNFSDGSELTCTKYHKFYIQKKYPSSKLKIDIIKSSSVEVVEAQHLKSGMKIIKCDYPVIDNENNLESAYEDGINNINIPFNYSLKSKLNWFAGYCDERRCFINNNLNLLSSDKDNLMNIKLMLQTCGVSCKIINNCNDSLSWRLLIASNELQKLVDLGFSPKRLIIDEHAPQKSATGYVTITDIVDNGRIDRTFCFNEKKRHAGIFNGVIAGNCAEILEYSSDDEYACCCLASIGLSKFVKYKYPEGDIKIYTKSGCKYCKALKNLLYSKGIEYTEINLDNDDERKAFYDETNKRLGLEGENAINTVPQVFVSGKLMGGYTNFKRHITPYIDYKTLEEVVGVIVKNLNKIIDLNFYPVIETKRSNERHRPLGIGVQGFADMLALMRIPFESKEAFEVNTKVFETIYYSACKASCELAKRDGAYSSFRGSPLSKGLFQFDLWGAKPVENRYNWDELRGEVMKHGVRNSLFTALMPTASTSQILGNNEAFEPYTSNIYVRRTIAGDFTVINKHLIRDLNELGLWDKDMKNELIRHNGSVQYIENVPDDIKKLYKTVWEVKQKAIIDLAANRGPYICQTQSMNLHFEEPNYKILNSALFYGWRMGLKTSCYYIRSRPKVQANQFTVKIKKEEIKQVKQNEEEQTSIDNSNEASAELSNEVSENNLTVINDPACMSCSG